VAIVRRNALLGMVLKWEIKQIENEILIIQPATGSQSVSDSELGLTLQERSNTKNLVSYLISYLVSYLKG
jgi:hypothetical protein